MKEGDKERSSTGTVSTKKEDHNKGPEKGGLLRAVSAPLREKH